MADYIGLKLGNYRIVRMIGRGGFANVYQGEHIYLKTPAAIKVLKMQLVNDGLEKFLHEARIIAALEHPHIVRVMEFGVEGITPFLVMNYANNGTMRQQYPKHITLPWASIISYTRQIADALQYAHDHGVIHRDVKPENMLLDKNQHIQLSDFGLAVIAQNIKAGQLSSSAGTTAYMAPEQLQGQPCRASDQYALGIVVYEWLCGSLPFTGAEREMTLHHLYTLPPSLHAKAPHISPAIGQVIMKTLAKDPQARFASVQEFALALEQAASETLLDKEVGSATPLRISAISSSDPFHEQAGSTPFAAAALRLSHQQTPINASSPSNFLPQLPLVAYESTLTNNGRILQPSLGPSISSHEELSLPSAFSSEDGTPQSSHASEGFLPPHTPLQFSNFAISTFQSITPGAGGDQLPPLPQTQTQISIGKQKHTAGHAVLTALVGIAIIGLIIGGGTVIWAKFTPDTVKSSLAQLTTPPTPVHTSPSNSSTTKKATNTHKAGSPPATLPSRGNAPASTPQPGSTPRPGSTPIPVKAPVPAPTSAPAPIPTPIVPLTVALVNPPDVATAGSTITIVTQASRGGVTIVLNGKARSFGQLTANSQGIATFPVKIPLKSKRIALTATAIDSSGEQVQSATQIITVT